MSLFGKSQAEKVEQKPSLFINRKEDKKDEESKKEIPGILFGGAGEEGNGTGGGTGESGGGSREGNSPIERSERGSRERGVFQFSPADEGNNGQPGGENRKSEQGTSRPIQSALGTTRPSSESGTQGTSQEEHNRRPNLSFTSSENETKEIVPDVKIQKRRGRKPSKDEFLSEEQVEILFTGMFDGIALFRGNHWKLKKEELEVVPALARILNRMVEALPTKYAKQAFNIMDYVIVLGAIGAIIASRIKEGKEIKKNGQSASISERKHIPPGNEGSGEPNSNSSPSISIPAKRNEDGKSFLPPITDLAQSINRIS